MAPIAVYAPSTVATVSPSPHGLDDSGIYVNN